MKDMTTVHKEKLLSDLKIVVADHWRPVNAARFRQEANNHAG